MADKQTIETALTGIERLQRMFLFERIVCLGGAVIAIVLMAAIAIMIMRAGRLEPDNWMPLFGSGGLFMTTGFGVTFYLNKSFDLLRELMRGAANDA